MLSSWAQALKSLKAYPLRVGLSILGIAIGVAAMVSLLIIMQSAKTNVDHRVESLGSNLIVAVVNPPVRHVKNPRKLTLGRTMTMAQGPGIAQAAPVNYQTAVASYGNKQAGLSVYGTTPAFTQIMRYSLAYGQYLSPLDMKYHLRGVDLGAQTSRALFGMVNPVGKTVKLDGVPYTVVGVLAAKGAMLGVNQDTVAIIPMTTYMDQFAMHSVRFIYASASSPQTVGTAIAGLTHGLLKWFHDSNRFTVLTQAQILGTANRISGILTGVLAGVAAIALLVGGIGMLNVLIISVSERIREIGIRKSVGARRSHILSQFLIEAIVIASVGGVFGIGGGLGVSWLATDVVHLQLTIQWRVIGMILGGTVLLGVIFGIYPAFRAALMTPARALRHE